jgi:hypothetical protein
MEEAGKRYVAAEADRVESIKFYCESRETFKIGQSQSFRI